MAKDKPDDVSGKLKDYEEALEQISAGPCDIGIMSAESHRITRGCQSIAENVLAKWEK